MRTANSGPTKNAPRSCLTSTCRGTRHRPSNWRCSFDRKTSLTEPCFASVAGKYGTPGPLRGLHGGTKNTYSSRSVSLAASSHRASDCRTHGSVTGRSATWRAPSPPSLSTPAPAGSCRMLLDGYLKELRDSTWQVIDAGTFVEGLSRPETLPPRSVLLTFDDGYRSMRHTVVALLSAYRFPSVVFVPTSFVGDTNRFDRDVEPE